MLYRLFQDAADAVRLRFHPPLDYRYSPAAVFGVLLALTVLNAVSFSLLLGNGRGVFSLAALLTIGEWLLLAKVMRHAGRSPPGRLLGFTLATQALQIPLLLVVALPEAGMAAVLWRLWSFYVQARGFMLLGPVSRLRLAGAYLIYLLALFILLNLLLNIYIAAGWLSLEDVLANIRTLQSRLGQP